jgi:hypothetical protein
MYGNALPCERLQKRSSSTMGRAGCKTVWIRRANNIFAHAAHHRHATTAKWPDGAIPAAAGALAILSGSLVFINLKQAVFKDVAKGGIEFAAGIHSAVGQ